MPVTLLTVMTPSVSRYCQMFLKWGSKSPPVRSLASPWCSPSMYQGPGKVGGVRRRRNQAGDRDAARGTLLHCRYVQVCTAGVSLCTLFHNIILHPVRTPSGKCRSCSRSPRGVQEGTLRGAAPSEDTPGGCLSPSHGPSGPPTCSGRALAASKTLLLERKNTGGKRRRVANCHRCPEPG